MDTGKKYLSSLLSFLKPNSVGETAALGFQPGTQMKEQLKQPFPTSSKRKYLQLILMLPVILRTYKLSSLMLHNGFQKIVNIWISSFFSSKENK